VAGLANSKTAKVHQVSRLVVSTRLLHAETNATEENTSILLTLSMEGKQLFEVPGVSACAKF
jgi:hypothetical protein